MIVLRGGKIPTFSTKSEPILNIKNKNSQNLSAKV